MEGLILTCRQLADGLVLAGGLLLLAEFQLAGNLLETASCVHHMVLAVRLFCLSFQVGHRRAVLRRRPPLRPSPLRRSSFATFRQLRIVRRSLRSAMNTAVVRDFRTTQLPAAPHPAGQLHPMNGMRRHTGLALLIVLTIRITPHTENFYCLVRLF